MSRLRILTTVLLAFLPTLSHAASVDCSDARGTFVYHQSSYSGGAAPYPGMEMSRTSWTFYGQELYREVGYNYCDPYSLPSGGVCPVPGSADIKDADLTIQFMTGSEHTLWESDPTQPWNYSRKYLVQAEIFRPSGKDIPVISGRRHEDYLICYESRVMYP